MYKDSIFNRYASNLTHRYEFNDTGSTITDSIGTVNGTLANGASVITEDENDFVRLLGTSSRINFTDSLVPIGEKTIRFRFRMNGETGTHQTLFASVYNGSGSYNTFLIYYVNTKQVHFNILLNGVSYVIQSNTILALNEWHEVTFSYNGSKACIFIDGELDSETDMVLANESYPYNAHMGYYIDMSGYYRYFNGDIDYLEFYNKAIDIREPLFLLKDSSDKYYSVYKDNYDTTSSSYNELTEVDVNKYGFFLNELMTKDTIETETFKPIDKFNNFRLVSIKEEKVSMQGLKSNKGMVVGRYSFSTRLAKNIDFFELVSTISDDSSIKMAVSVDTGTTWKVYNGTDWVDLTNTCPLKNYADMTDDEKTKWETFRDEVYTNGMDAKILNTIDFNEIKDGTMMFAYVFDRNSYADSCEMSKLQYQFDANGSYRLLGNDEVQISQNASAISIVPKIDMDLVKVNVGSSGEVTINQGGGEIMITEEEYQKDWSEIFG